MLDDLTLLPLLPESYVLEFGPTLVVAPHPDDESLGCGGALALLAAAGIPVRVLFVSDGTGSHPGSRRYPPEALRSLREEEARGALEALHIPITSAAFLRLPDRCVPRIGSAGFTQAAEACRRAIGAADFTPQTILLPWRRDPHTDHRATWELVSASICASAHPPRLIEYPIWIWDLGGPDDMPEPGEMRAWRLDISSVLDRKREAIAAHRSQTTPMIDDDPVGWTLPTHTLERFQKPGEIYLEAIE